LMPVQAKKFTRLHLNTRKLCVMTRSSQHTYGEKLKIGGSQSRPARTKEGGPISKITRTKRTGVWVKL
jgi:hypothetical protein